jgi:hypothetical protein
MRGFRRQVSVQNRDATWLKPIDLHRFTTVRFAPSLQRAEQLGAQNGAFRAACMAEHPSGQARRLWTATSNRSDPQSIRRATVNHRSSSGPRSSREVVGA